MQEKRKEGSQTLFNRLEFQEQRLRAATAALEEALVLGAKRWDEVESKIREALTEISRAETLRFAALRILAGIKRGYGRGGDG